MRALPVVVLLAGIVLSMIALIVIKSMEDQQEAERFSLVAKQNTLMMHAKLVDTFELIQSLQALYAASQYIERSEFAVFAKIRLREHPNIQSIAWLPRVSYIQRTLFEQRVSHNWFKDIKVKDVHVSGKWVVAAKRAQYFPIDYIEPAQGNEYWVGFDVSSDVKQRKILNKARDTGLLQASSREKQGDDYVIRVYQAVYQGGLTPSTVVQRQKKLKGFVSGTLRINRILSTGILHYQGQTNWVFDMSAWKGEQRLFPVKSSFQSMDELELEQCVVTPLNVVGRLWNHVNCVDDVYLKYFSHHQFSTLMLLTILFLTLFLTAYLWVLTRQRMAAQQFIQRIQKSEQQLKQIMNHVGDAIITANDVGRVVRMNCSALTLFGYEESELIGESIQRLMPSFELEGYGLNTSSLLSQGAEKVVGGCRIETTARRKNGGVFPIEMSITHVQDDGQVMSITLIRDISIMKKYEMMQDLAWQRMDRFFKVTVEGLFFHKNGVITDVNSSGAEMVGLAPKDLIGHRLLEFVGSSYYTVTSLNMCSYVDDVWESVLIHSSGSEISVDMQGKRIAYADEDLRVLAVRDISQRKHAEKRVKDMAAALRQLIDTANTLIFGVDVEGRISEWNHAAERMTGYQKETVMGHILFDFFIIEPRQIAFKKIMRSVLDGHEVSNVELSFLTKDSKNIDLLLNASPCKDTSGVITGAIGVGQDVTELNVSKAQMIQAAKLATLGEMTTGVAHELNQPLNVMRMALGNSRRKLEKGDSDLNYYLAKMNRMDDQVTRMASIVDHMRMFGRKASESFVVLDLRDMVNRALDLMGEQLRLANIEISKVFCTCAPFFYGHQIQMEQVILNLLGNARDAMSILDKNKQKKLFVRVGCVGIHTVLMIEDNGGGIPQGQLDRVFEPFFTTKEPGKGTGLGLSVSYGIIKDMGGRMMAENVRDGARLTVSLPIVKKPCLKK